MPPSWPRVRAALIAVALVGAALDGLPIPAPERAAAFSPWVGRVAAWAEAQRARALAPFSRLSGELVLVQRWVLFAGASRDRYRLEVAGREAGRSEFELLYRADDPKHRLLASTIEYRRVRGAFNPRTREPPQGYPAFASFVRERLFAQRPKLEEVRVRMEEIRILDRGGYMGTGRYAHEITSVRRPERP